MAKPLILSDLRGGLNDTDTPAELRDDQLVLIENVDLDRAACGGKRRGIGHVSNGYAGTITQPTFLYRHTPTNNEHETELWLGGVTSGGVGALAYRDNAGWATYANVGFGLDTLIVASGAYALEAQSLHGKLFLAFPAESGGIPVDRLHVRETVGGVTRFRRAGLREPAVPTLGNTGSGSYAGVRYARIRYTAQDTDGSTLRRSEPSDSATHTPSGSPSGMTVTRPALMGEGETHWEVELSTDNVNFYRVTTLAIATGSYTDTVVYETGYAGLDNPLSADIGDYSLIWSPKFLSADQDRLLYAGAWVNARYKSRVGWTPVAGDVTGNGNDERVETDTDPYLDLDGFDGGELTDFKGPINGYHYAFKWSQIFKIVRTGTRARGYEAQPITKALGSLPRSAVRGFDESGQSCVYFPDPLRGPHRLGAAGLEDLGEDIRDVWGRLNLDATLPCRSVFYTETRQWHLWIAVDGAMLPNLKLVLHVKHVRRDADGGKRGWSTHTGKAAQATAACLYADNLISVPSGTQSLRLKPYMTLPSTVASGQALLQQMDLGVADDGEMYQARMRTKPFLLGDLMVRQGVTAGALMAEAVSGGSLAVSLIRDYSRETLTKTASLTAPVSGQTRVVVPIDDLSLSDLFALQIEIGDTAPTSGTWALDQLTLITRDEERS